jgi:triacylglycerol esterase/lipase EstA (alpha/beta hydrolase family)
MCLTYKKYKYLISFKLFFILICTGLSNPVSSESRDFILNKGSFFKMKQSNSQLKTKIKEQGTSEAKFVKSKARKNNKKKKSLKNVTVIFVHGLGAPAEMYQFSKSIKVLFEDAGFNFYVSKYPAVTTIESGASKLYDELRPLVTGQKYHLVSHSMGGLVSRMMLHLYKDKDPKLIENCLSLTSLAVPHRGTPIATHAYKLISRINDSEKKSIIPFKKFSLEKSKELLNKLLNLLNVSKELVHSLTPEQMENSFNKEVKDLNHVKYYSVAFYIPNPVKKYTHVPYFRLTSKLNSLSGHKMNDGIVPTSSSLWGEVIKIMPGDHYAETLPFPFGKKFIYKDVFKLVIDNLNKNF